MVKQNLKIAEERIDRKFHTKLQEKENENGNKWKKTQEKRDKSQNDSQITRNGLEVIAILLLYASNMTDTRSKSGMLLSCRHSHARRVSAIRLTVWHISAHSLCIFHIEEILSHSHDDYCCRIGWCRRWTCEYIFKMNDKAVLFMLAFIYVLLVFSLVWFGL